MNLELHSQRASGNGLLSLNFNQDESCFAIGTERGFQIFNSDPLRVKMKKDFEDGGIAQVEMLYRSNFLALTGGGSSPKYAMNKVIIWDDLKGKPVFEMEFRSVVKAVRLRRDRIVVVLANRVFVYSFGAVPQKLWTLETTLNERGLIGLSQSPTQAFLAIPGQQRGQVQILNIANTTMADPLSSSNYNSAPSSLASSIIQSPTPTTSIIAAHTSSLACITISRDGHLLATCSEKGTIIRVFDTISGQLLHELRRGVDRANIYCLSFNEEATRLCVSSDKGTIHVFNLFNEINGRTDIGTNKPSTITRHGSSNSIGNRQSSLSFMQSMLPKYFGSEWSFATYQLPNETHSICAFSPIKNSNAILVLCADGSYFRLLFDPRVGGQCQREIFKRFYRLEN